MGGSGFLPVAAGPRRVEPLLQVPGQMRAVDQDSHRRFLCARCHEPVVLCRRCDHGQRYCGAACRAEARRQCLRRAGRRYRQSPAGRAANAERQRRLRARRGSGVTHHSVRSGSDGPRRRPDPPAPAATSGNRRPTEARAQEGSTRPSRGPSEESVGPSCSRCSAPCSHFTRFHFLSDRDRLPARRRSRRWR